MGGGGKLYKKGPHARELARVLAMPKVEVSLLNELKGRNSEPAIREVLPKPQPDIRIGMRQKYNSTTANYQL